MDWPGVVSSVLTCRSLPCRNESARIEAATPGTRIEKISNKDAANGHCGQYSGQEPPADREAELHKVIVCWPGLASRSGLPSSPSSSPPRHPQFPRRLLYPPPMRNRAAGMPQVQVRSAWRRSHLSRVILKFLRGLGSAGSKLLCLNPSSRVGIGVGAYLGAQRGVPS